MSDYAVFLHPHADVHHTSFLGHGTHDYIGAVIVGGRDWLGMVQTCLGELQT